VETLKTIKVSNVYLHKIMKEKIVIKSTDLFLTYGFKSVTMDEIANALGISKKTIYVYFKNKTKLVEAVAFHLFDTICGGIDCIFEKSANPIEELYEVKMFVMQHLKDEKASPQFQLKKYYVDIYDMLRFKQFEKMHESVTRSLHHGIETGVFRSSINVEFISRMYFNGMTGIKDETIFPSTLFKMNDLMEYYLEYHLRAIVTDKGMKILTKFIKNQTQQHA
jgi:AcrR family transcriptional regulator